MPGLQHAVLKRATAGDRALDLTITLAPRNRGQLDALLAAQSDRHSPLYHHYLTPQEYTARFAPTQADVDAVVVYLKGQGLAVRSVSGNRLAIHAAGSVASAEQAFAVHLGDYTYQGRAVYAPTDEPSVPANLGAIVQGIVGLDNVALYHSHAQRPNPKGVQPRGGSGPGGGYAPSDLRTAYDMNPLINTQGMDGTGQTVAIFELDGYDSTDVDTYLSFYGLGAPKYSNVLVDGVTNTPGPGAIEVELDMEVVSAVAPGATQKIYIGPNTGLGVFDTYSRIVSDNLAKVVSTSWGLCEQDSGTSFLDALHSIYQQAAAQGQAIFAASGDDGAFDCARSATGGSVLAVDSPADDPFVIGVGGTTLITGVGGAYIGETVWGDSVNALGGGGGLSTHFARPSYQTGPGTTNSFSNGNRQVPDISANADPNTGYSEFCTAGSICAGAGFIVIGGTSAAAPLWAGIAADVNQYLSNPAFGMPTLGEGHTSFYTIFNHTEPQAAYHDVTSGNNLHYPATAGYDLATGIGTPDVWNLAQDLTIPIPHIQPSQPGVALATTPGVSPGAVTLTLSNTGLGPLNWSQTATLPAWLSLDATSGSVAMGASQTLTLTFSIPPADPAQTYFTTLTFTDPHADNAPVSIPVTVVATGAASTTWYFAEGTTNSGFTEFLTLANPGATAATVQVKYLLGVGAPVLRSYPVAAHSRATVNVNTELGAGQNVAMVVTSDQPIIAERPMFFTFRGTIPSGTDV
ncbi:MAG TPA: protease pro-enzyme activation domain-containing protein, partial [Ktedonobacterales bacterium]|nr:protease pro-enzyme activation domain-containing protein [Ktedonobacterales bacterium]